MSYSGHRCSQLPFLGLRVRRLLQRVGFAAFSPTELRLLLIIGNIALLSKPFVMIAGKRYLLFDVGGTIGIAGIGLALLRSIVKHTRYLYRVEALS